MKAIPFKDGRAEAVRGAYLLGREEQAEACFRKQMENLEACVLDQDATKDSGIFLHQFQRICECEGSPGLWLK